MTGVEMISAERQRQVDVEGWTVEHDASHLGGDLVAAAICYADYAANLGPSISVDLHALWPWCGWWKPSDDPVRNLVKAGALIAAEIDRQAALNKEGP